MGPTPGWWFQSPDQGRHVLGMEQLVGRELGGKAFSQDSCELSVFLKYLEGSRTLQSPSESALLGGMCNQTRRGKLSRRKGR